MRTIIIIINNLFTFIYNMDSFTTLLGIYVYATVYRMIPLDIREGPVTVHSMFRFCTAALHFLLASCFSKSCSLAVSRASEYCQRI
ncbi:hypothetical protein FKM82_025370 [Ascaphus truei]